MNRLAVILLFCLSAGPLSAQSTAISRSEQFTINGPEPGHSRPFVPEIATNRTLVKLEPASLSVTCERIKQSLLTALNVPDQWRGKIRISLHPARVADEEIQVASTRYADSWNYEVSLPDPVDPARLVRAITQVLLVEMANRQFPRQSATLPAWLAEGMPQYLIAINDVDLVVRPAATPARDGQLPERVEQREGRFLSPFARARDRLRQRTPLSIQQLSDPAAAQLEGIDAETYRDTALFFIDELLKLKNGGACLFAMLPELPWDPDWRIGFLKAFHQHFQRAKDLEKWWALQSAYFVARDSNQVWPRAASIAKLQEILRTPFQVTLGSNQPALYTDVSLQAIIKGWKLDRQLPVLREKITLLDQLQVRISPDLRPVLKQYRDVLQKYLTRQETPAVRTTELGAGKQPFTPIHLRSDRAPDENDPIVKQTLKQLDLLDARLEDLRRARRNLPEARTFKAP